MLLKKPNQKSNSPKQFRPICLLKSIGKLYEKLIHERLYHFLHLNNKISKLQFGFKKQTSCSDALQNIINAIHKNKAERKYTLNVYIDIQGAFDNADHTQIIKQLHNMDVNTTYTRIIESFLSNRTVNLQIGNNKTTRTPYKGCPQGSVLSPLLWNVLINKILEIPMGKGCQIQAYADDLLLSISNKKITPLFNAANETLSHIARTLKDLNLKANPSKTQFQLFKANKKTIHPPLLLDKHLIEKVHCTKYLGLHIDAGLTWKDHLNNTTNKIIALSRKLNLAIGKTWGLHPTIIRLYYKTIIEPILLYGIENCANILNKPTYLAKYTKIQRIFLLQITKAAKTSSNDALQVITGIPPIDLVIKAKINLFYSKNGITPGPTFDKPVNYIHNAPPDIRPLCRVKIDSLCEDTACAGAHFWQIYTDGSKVGDKVGCAFVAKNGTYEVTKLYSLAPVCSITQAELLAIKEAVYFACNEPGVDKSAKIFSDSQAALNILKRHTTYNRIALDIKNLMVANPEIHFCFEWVRGHAGLQGNEEADAAAKGAAQSNLFPSYDRAPLSFFKGKVQKELALSWDKRWRESTKGGITKKFLPNIQTTHRKKPLDLDLTSTQYLTGHGNFNQYLHRINKANTYKCFCGALDNPLHRLKSCPATIHLTTAQRIKLNANNQDYYEKILTNDFRSLCSKIDGFYKHRNTRLANRWHHRLPDDP